MPKLIDLTGQKFGRLTVIERAIVKDKRFTYWKCKCDCGNTTIIRGSSLKSGNTTSCGCVFKEKMSIPKDDLTGKHFGRLTVIEKSKNENRIVKWKCKCICGNETEVSTTHLKSGKTRSCGCYNKEVTRNIKLTHGKTGSKIYGTWNTMKERCSNPNVDCYSRYGARGIKVCEEWQQFEIFYNWAIENGYKENLTIDRIDFNGNYEPSNCRWVTQKEQANNTSANHYIKYQNQVYTLMQLSEKFGIPYHTLKRRIYKGWDIEKAVTKPLRNDKRRVVNET